MINLTPRQVYDSYDSGSGVLRMNGENGNAYIYLRSLGRSDTENPDPPKVGELRIEIDLRTMSVTRIERYES